MSELITVPTFTYHQGKHSNDTLVENPIRIEYYNGTICLKQDGGYDTEETINIDPDHLVQLFRAIKKHLPEAEQRLKS